MARLGAWLGLGRQGVARHGMDLGSAWLGMAGHGTAWSAARAEKQKPNGSRGHYGKKTTTSAAGPGNAGRDGRDNPVLRVFAPHLVCETAAREAEGLTVCIYAARVLRKYILLDIQAAAFGVPG